MRNIILTCLLLAYAWAGKAQNEIFLEKSELKGHSTEILKLVYSPNGQYLASLDKYQDVKLWSLATGKCITTLHTNWYFRDMVFSPDSQELVTVGKGLAFWEASTGKLKHQEDELPKDIYGDILVYTPDGKNITISSNYHIKYHSSFIHYNIAKRKFLYLKGDYKLSKYSKEKGRLVSFAYLDEGKTLMSVENTSRVAFFNAQDVKLVGKLNSPDVTCATLYNNQQNLLCGTEKGEIELWDIKARNRDNVTGFMKGAKTESQYKAVQAVFTMPDASFFTVCGALGRIFYIEFLPTDLASASKWVKIEENVLQTAISPNGEQIAVGTDKGRVFLYDLRPLYGKYIPTPKQPEVAVTPNNLKKLVSNIPITKTKNEDAIAVIIGNKNYQKTKSVDFAQADAQLMKQYLIKTLGFSEGNILYQEDATLADFRTLFGEKDNHKGKLFNLVQAGKSDVFVYYVGHGAPSLNTSKGFFVPVESEPKYIDLSGYDMEIFYQNLAKIPAKSFTVVLDACFSGVNLYDNISPVVIKPKGIQALKNATILSACKEDEVATWYNAERHGLFTFFFLQALQDYKNTDKNKDNQLTMEEIWQTISDQTQGLPYYARLLHNVTQNPTLQGDKQRIIASF